MTASCLTVRQTYFHLYFINQICYYYYYFYVIYLEFCFFQHAKFGCSCLTPLPTPVSYVIFKNLPRSSNIAWKYKYAVLPNIEDLLNC